MMGEDDQIVPLANGKILEALIPNSRLEIFEQGGHLFMLTHREQTISSLRGFLDAPERTDRKAA
jgi:pimeloyl-ACP methyl ester carboxylesterase